MTSTLRIRILNVLQKAAEYGLPEADFQIASELHNNFEHGLAFDHILTQLYEYEIPISSSFWEEIKGITRKMGIPEEEVSFMKELVRDE